jgi:hypothetical protein
MPQVRGTFDALYDNVDKTIAGIMKGQLKELPRIYPKVFTIRTSDRKFERIVTYVPFGDSQSKPEGEAYAFDTLEQGYTKDFIHTENGLGFEATQTALEDDAENILQRAGEWLAFSARYVEEKRAANPFNNGFAASGAANADASGNTPDGTSLFNVAHPLKGGGSARNRLATDADLSATSLAQAMIDTQNEQKDEAGHLAAPINSWTLYVPPSLEFTADRIVNSVSLPGTADNDRNPLKARRNWEIVVNPHLSDQDAWFLVAGNKSQHGLTFYRRVPIALEAMEKDVRTGNRIFKTRHRFSLGAWTWVGTFGTSGG